MLFKRYKQGEAGSVLRRAVAQLGSGQRITSVAAASRAQRSHGPGPTGAPALFGKEAQDSRLDWLTSKPQLERKLCGPGVLLSGLSRQQANLQVKSM